MTSPEISQSSAPPPVSAADAPGRGFSRRRLMLLGAASLGLSGTLVAGADILRRNALPCSDGGCSLGSLRDGIASRSAARPGPDIFEEVMPERGINTGVRFGDAIQKVIAAGVLDPAKFRAQGARVPHWVERLMAAPSAESIVFTRERAPWLVNLLWPIGLANKAAFNRRSLINTVRLPGFASTGGWTLGRAPNGSAYFNCVDAVPLTDRQAFLALAIATNTFRPCCDNNTFFQDCNHGSALLGLIELAVSQGATADRIYRIALTANSFWFPEQYARTAQYFTRFAKRPWRRVSAPQVLSAGYSSLSGWQRHIDAPLRQAKIAPPLDPRAQPATCAL